MKSLTSELRTQTGSQKTSSWDSLKTQEKKKIKGTIIMREKIRGLQERSGGANTHGRGAERRRKEIRPETMKKISLGGGKPGVPP